MSIVYAVPYRPPVPPVPLWRGLDMRWTGWDGSEWELTRPGGGVLLANGDVRGLSMPPGVRHTSEHVEVAGSRHRGSRTLERGAFWPLAIYSDAGSQGWVDLDRAFWRTMDRDRPGVWSVEQPSGETRYLTCRFDDDGAHGFPVDPVSRGWALYGVTLVANDPFWRGDPILRTWAAEEPVDFFGGTGGPPFHLSSSSAMGSARITNPGDELTHPLWLMYGPMESGQVGVGDLVVDVPFELTEGEALVIDTRPTVQSATVIGAPTVNATAGDLAWYVEQNLPSGVDVTRDLGEAAFAAVPAGESVDLSVSIVGTGMVQMLLTPLYRRAW